MLKKFLKEAMTIIAGKQAEELVDLLEVNKYINEFIIAKKLNLTINQTRNILYKISDYGLVSSIRKKDKRKGWYTYFWKIETLKSLEFIKNDLLKKIDNFGHQIKSRETKRFYICPKCHLELNEENALFNNFTCTECGSLLILKDNVKLINEMKRNLEKVKKDLVFVQDEISKESVVANKIKAKEVKKERKELEAKKHAKKLARKKMEKKNKKFIKMKKIKKHTQKKQKHSKKKIKKLSKRKRR